MNKELILKKTVAFVKEKSFGEGSGHDWYHIERVYNLTSYLCEKENGDEFIALMAALLHDIDDWKFKSNDSDYSTTLNYLESINIESQYIDKIMNIIKTMSFKGGIKDSSQNTLEGQIVQDADRLDAIGAIGIARTFAYGGNKNRVIYDPNIKPMNYKTLEEVKSKENHTINHFYEKLLKLKDLMNTDSAKVIANKRHKLMETFLEEFYSEWNFNKK